jgi:hypothetical protein
VIEITWDDVKVDGSTTLPASEYNDLVAAAKHTSAQAAKWSIFNASANYIFQIAGVQMLSFTYSTNVTTITGGGTSGDDLVLKASGSNAYPKIILQGNTVIDMYAVSGVNLYSSATNYGRFYLTGSDCTLLAMGTNYNVSFVPNGTGLVKFGTYTVKAAEVHTGYITILDSGGTSRKVMVCA